MELDAFSLEQAASDKATARNVEVMREWSTRTPEGKRRRIHMHFFARPVEMTGDDRVRQVVVERTALDATGGASGTGEMYTVDADFVVRSVGYRGTALDEVPFDSGKNVIPSVEGRVQRDGVTVPGEYVAGWIKRGPTGIIGTNKKCAVGTVASLIEDVSANLLPSAPHGTIEEFDARIAALETVNTEGWRSIDKAERALGESAGRARTSIHTADGMLSAAKA